MDAIHVTLPAGLATEDGWSRSAVLRLLCGRDEVFLAEEGQTLLPAARTTALLERCLVRLGPLAPVPPAAVRALTIGDREALVLHLRRATLGERLSCVVQCPNAACREKLDVDLQVRDLLLPPYPYERDHYELDLEDGDGRCHLRFRLPTGGDQEAAAPVAAADLEAAAALVLTRCVLAVQRIGPTDPPAPDDQPEAALPPAVSRELPGVMAELDPQAELLLHQTCPVCGTAFATLFDAAEFFYRELLGREEDLDREIHCLALHYHWSESEILALPRRRRQRYLDLLADTLAGGGRR